MGESFLCSNAGASVYAFIVATYPQGSICTCSDGIKILQAKNTSGTWAFGVPNAGSWAVTATDGLKMATYPVTVTSKGSSVRAILDFRIQKDIYQEVTYIQSTGGDCVIPQAAVTESREIRIKYSLPTIILNSGRSFLKSTNNNIRDYLGMYSDSSSYYNISWNLGDKNKFLRHNVNTIFTETFTRTGTSGIWHYNNNSNSVTLDSNLDVSTYPPMNLSIFGDSCSRIYELDITIDGVLTTSLVPCYRKSDSVAGFFDSISYTFFPVTSNANVVVGSDVT